MIWLWFALWSPLAAAFGTCQDISFNSQNITSQSLAAVLDTAECPKEQIIKLQLANNKLTTITADDFSAFSSLQQLQLGSNPISEIEANAFSKLTNLVYFSVGNQLTAIPEGAFASLSHLTQLTLSNNQLKIITAGSFVGLTNLRYLMLYGNHITLIASDAFSSLTSLVDLQLSRNNLTSFPAGALSSLTNLISLDISDNQITAISLGTFSAAASLSDLRMDTPPSCTSPLTNAQPGRCQTISPTFTFGYIVIFPNGTTSAPTSPTSPTSSPTSPTFSMPLTPVPTPKQFQPELARWNRFNERGYFDASPGKSDVVNFSFTMSSTQQYPVYKHDSLRQWLWSDGQYLLSTCHPPESYGFSTVLSLQVTNNMSMSIGNQTFTFGYNSKLMNFNLSGNKLLLFSNYEVLHHPSRDDGSDDSPLSIPNGTWTTVAKGQLSTDGYCLPARLFVDVAHHKLDNRGFEIIMDNPFNNYSAVTVTERDAMGDIAIFPTSLVYPNTQASVDAHVHRVRGSGRCYFRGLGVGFGPNVTVSCGQNATASPYSCGKCLHPPILNISTGNISIDGLYFPRCLCGGLLFNFTTMERRAFKCEQYYLDSAGPATPTGSPTVPPTFVAPTIVAPTPPNNPTQATAPSTAPTTAPATASTSDGDSEASARELQFALPSVLSLAVIACLLFAAYKYRNRTSAQSSKKLRFLHEDVSGVLTTSDLPEDDHGEHDSVPRIDSVAVSASEDTEYIQLTDVLDCKSESQDEETKTEHNPFVSLSLLDYQLVTPERPVGSGYFSVVFAVETNAKYRKRTQYALKIFNDESMRDYQQEIYSELNLHKDKYTSQCPGIVECFGFFLAKLCDLPGYDRELFQRGLGNLSAGGFARHHNQFSSNSLRLMVLIELCEMSLSSYIQARTTCAPVPLHVALDMGVQLCDAVSHLHQHPGCSIAHLDIKPANILLSASRLKLSDLGVAQALGQSKYRSKKHNLIFNCKIYSSHVPFWNNPNNLFEEALLLDAWACSRVLLDIFALSDAADAGAPAITTQENHEKEVQPLLSKVYSLYPACVGEFLVGVLASSKDQQVTVPEIRQRLLRILLTLRNEAN